MHDLERLNMELLQAQLLLQASHRLYEDIVVGITRHRFRPGVSDDAPLRDELSARIAKFAQRDEEIRRMLKRLQKLDKPTARVCQDRKSLPARRAPFPG